MSELKSGVWKHFKLSEHQSNTTICQICEKSLKYLKGSTSSMANHLRVVHGIAPEKGKINEVLVQNSLRRGKELMDAFVKRDSVDGFSIRSITQSQFIRESISSKGFSLPKNETNVMNLILKDFESKKKLITEHLMNEKSKGEKYSLTMDEWTSIRGRRYINVNIHNSKAKFYNLGLSRIFGTCNSGKTQELVRQKLIQFDISLDSDIVACTADGAAVNIKFGLENPTELQLCLAHGIHLEVMDVVYEKCSCIPEIAEIHIDESEDNFEEDEDVTGEQNTQKMIADINLNLEDVRKIIRYFKNSSVRNNILQINVKKQHGHELTFI